MHYYKSPEVCKSNEQQTNTWDIIIEGLDIPQDWASRAEQQ